MWDPFVVAGAAAADGFLKDFFAWSPPSKTVWSSQFLIPFGGNRSDRRPPLSAWGLFLEKT